MHGMDRPNRTNLRSVARIALAIVLLAAVSQAAVTRIDVIERSDVLGGRDFGDSGPYERIIARVHFAVDPTSAANGIIADVTVAPRNAAGLVEFSSDLYMLRPRDGSKSNGTVLYEVSNRGGKGILALFNLAYGSLDPRTAPEFGDGLLMEQGYTLVWLGWQSDMPDRPGLVRLYPAIAKGITGIVRSEYVPSEKVPSFPLADRNHRPYPVRNPGDPSVTMTVRDRGDGPRRVIPRNQWKFSGGNVEMDAGFEPGKFYEVVYQSQDPPLVGLGPAAVRDFISFLKHGGPDAVSIGSPQTYVQRAIGYGTSQSGRFLRKFLYDGFNRDERGRQVFDGVWAHVGGAGRGGFNHRFAQPSRDGHLMLNTFYPTDLFPFSDLPQQDQETGLRQGLLDRARDERVVPKIFYTNGSYEYWGRAASLIHSTLDARRDMELPPTTRIYFFTGTQHGPGSFPPRQEDTQNLSNPNDYRYLMRALLAGLNDWVASGKEPPASAYPRIASKQLVPPSELRFPNIPGAAVPTLWHRAWHADYGPEFASKGIVTIDPPKLGSPFPVLVPQVDSDGNETTGLRLPEIQVPLGTYAGWNLRDPDIGAPDSLYSMVGSFFPLPRTKAERESKHDPRLSIEERYKSRLDYLAKIQSAARGLAASRYLLEYDIPKLVQQATEQWQYLIPDRN